MDNCWEFNFSDSSRSEGQKSVFHSDEYREPREITSLCYKWKLNAYIYMYLYLLAEYI